MRKTKVRGHLRRKNKRVVPVRQHSRKLKRKNRGVSQLFVKHLEGKGIRVEGTNKDKKKIAKLFMRYPDIIDEMPEKLTIKFEDLKDENFGGFAQKGHKAKYSELTIPNKIRGKTEVSINKKLRKGVAFDTANDPHPLENTFLHELGHLASSKDMNEYIERLYKETAKMNNIKMPLRQFKIKYAKAILMSPKVSRLSQVEQFKNKEKSFSKNKLVQMGTWLEEKRAEAYVDKHLKKRKFNQSEMGKLMKKIKQERREAGHPNPNSNTFSKKEADRINEILDKTSFPGFSSKDILVLDTRPYSERKKDKIKNGKDKR